MEKTKLGIIGCGNISGVYIRNCRTFDILEVAACSDIVMEKARAKAAESNIPRVCTVEELLADPEISIVLNLTIPKAHGEVALAALEAGKHVWNEKPLALTREEGKRILQLAKSKNLRVGCAPDTVLGGGIQTCRKLIDDGVIGRPVAATAFMMGHGHEGWHPDPDFYYQPGGGPMFDMGPYYLSALFTLMGPARRVTGAAKITFPERTITSQPKAGTKIKVNTPTHIAGIMDFVSGAVGTIITSFDVWAAHLPCIEIYGSEGTISAPDPNGCGGPVNVYLPKEGKWRDVPLMFDYTDSGRAVGVADMAHAIRSGRPHRASGEIAFHVLDIMHGFLDAEREGKYTMLNSVCERTAPMPVGLPSNRLDD